LRGCYHPRKIVEPLISNGKRMNNSGDFLIKDGEQLILATNPFRFIYEDAIFLQKAAESASNRDLEARYARNSVLLFIVGMEALINRVLDCFICKDFPTFIREKIGDLPMDIKWYMAPLWCNDDPKVSTYEADKEPFQSFRELITIRNSYVHPRSKRMKLKILDAHRKIADYSDPDSLNWPQTKIPKDINHFDKKSALKAKEVVDSMIELLDGFLGGKIKKDNWWLTETVTKTSE
jgi:hypothetical protein